MNFEALEENYKMFSNIRDNVILRNSFHDLTKAVYGFDFELWHQAGFWQEAFIPYVLVHEGKVVANISVNIMDYVLEGTAKRYIQLGTVATDKAYRNQGLSRYLMEKILQEWTGKADGIYLYANDSVLEFYPKFGFKKSQEYQYSFEVWEDESAEANINSTESNTNSAEANTSKATTNNIIATPVDMNVKENLEKVCQYITDRKQISEINMKNSVNLTMFYATSFMKNFVYYLPMFDAFVIAEKEENELIIHDIISMTDINIKKVADELIKFFSKDRINKVILGFTPKDRKGFGKSVRKEENCTFFILGEDLKKIEERGLRFPSLSHT